MWSLKFNRYSSQEGAAKWRHRAQLVLPRVPFQVAAMHPRESFPEVRRRETARADQVVHGLAADAQLFRHRPDLHLIALRLPHVVHVFSSPLLPRTRAAPTRGRTGVGMPGGLVSLASRPRWSRPVCRFRNPKVCGPGPIKLWPCGLTPIIHQTDRIAHTYAVSEIPLIPGGKDSQGPTSATRIAPDGPEWSGKVH